MLRHHSLGDASPGPCALDDVVQSSPRQRKRRGGPSGTRAIDFGRLGPRQQQQRAAAAPASGAGQAAGCLARRAQAVFGSFGQMACHRLEPPHAARTEPLPQAVDQRRATLRPVGASASGRKLRLPRLHAFGDGDGETERLEAEAGIDRLDRCARA